MIKLLTARGYGPIGVDIGSRSVKLLQFNADCTRVIDAARREVDQLTDQSQPAPKAAAQAIQAVRQEQNFKGRDAVFCLGARELFVQNIRIPKTPPEEMRKVLEQEATNRLSYPFAE